MQPTNRFTNEEAERALVGAVFLDASVLDRPAKIDRRDTFDGNSVLRGQDPDRR